MPCITSPASYLLAESKLILGYPGASLRASQFPGSSRAVLTVLMKQGHHRQQQALLGGGGFYGQAPGKAT